MDWEHLPETVIRMDGSVRRFGTACLRQVLPIHVFTVNGTTLNCFPNEGLLKSKPTILGDHLKAIINLEYGID